MQKVVASFVASMMAFSSVALAARHTKGVIDEALISESKIAYWLKKRGEITPEDSDAEIQEKISAYIQRYRAQDKRHNKLPQNYRIPDTATKFKQQYSAAAVKQATDVNVLAVLIDFPNLTYANNGLSSNDTDLFYSDYSLAHYQDLLFSSNGFKGPDNETLMSVNQYYSLESGNTFNFNGQAFGWYRSKQSAAFYGGNGDGGSDTNVEVLVVEAIEAAVADGGVSLIDFDKKDPQDLDNDNITDEPDGYIDHVLIVHASVGEEAGGGILGTNAIWSHRFSVSEKEANITGSNIKVKNYTIVPIDSGSGVIAHEFGHDLGLDDEYDLKSTLVGSPVGYWSIMSGGSWLGERRGTQPTSFSPLARDLLQQKFGGNWLNQQDINANTLNTAGIQIALTQASDHDDKINQAKITLPSHKELFGKAQQGEFQLLADHQDETHFRQDFILTIPDAPNAQLSLWARWDIEEGYDYARFLINGNPLSNDFTVPSSTNISDVAHLLTGKLTDSPWTNLIFNLSSWQGQQVTLSIEYVTDPAVGGFGLAVDDINLITGSDRQAINDFETSVELTDVKGFSSFKRISDYKDAAPEYYYIQLRSNEKLDAGLVGENYDPGILLWYRNDAFTNNNSSEHPGQGFIAVVDADQHRLSFGNTERQIRDAAFSIFPQTPLQGDEHLTANSHFSDADDYSSPEQPQNGTKLPLWGIDFSVTAQDATSRNATISLSRTAIELSTEIAAQRVGRDVSFSHQAVSSYSVVKTSWDFGDGHTSLLTAPKHQYQIGGQYNVSLTIEDTSGATFEAKQLVTVGEQLILDASREQDSSNIFMVSVTSTVSGGIAPFSYQWNLGDGNTSSQATLNHVYTSIGEYDIFLSVTDAIGQEVTKELNVTIKSALNTDFTYTAASQVVTFSSQINNPSGDVVVNWDFGDGQSSTEQSPNHVYANSGAYNVTLNVTDATATTNKVTKLVIVSGTSNISSVQDEGSSGGKIGFVFIALAIAGLLRRRFD
ncbi:immune inhibitor A domain-containing protein [Psychrobium sp. nBUS_13]|uniref:immune inhibitor A domain-containing protein n=1 Tax=Psychrobium sp. nBUS_13 TaxID=3395319 RepID=UPI003EBCB436